MVNLMPLHIVEAAHLVVRVVLESLAHWQQLVAEGGPAPVRALYLPERGVRGDACALLRHRAKTIVVLLRPSATSSHQRPGRRVAAKQLARGSLSL